jgi:hypothetical protein
MKIIKQEIKEKPRKLTAKWTVTMGSSSPTLDEEIIDDVYREIQEEIDWEIMCEMMVKLGYTKVEMKWPKRMSELEAHEIKEWCRENLQGTYQARGNIWLFAREKDASMFILKWS